MVKKINAGKIKIGDDQPCFIIAEAGINHNGDINIAKKMIDLAKNVGVDCIKFQTFKAKDLSSDPNLQYNYEYNGKKISESQEEFFQHYEFSEDQWKEIIDYCKEKKIIFATTAQNPSDLDFIFSLTDMSFIKVGSDDLTNLSLIEYYAKKKKIMIISTGMAYEEEIKDALDSCRKTGNRNVIVLHCVSSYPAEAQDINLAKIKALRDNFGVIVGFSDHSKGIYASLGAVALGAKVVEKHFTLDKNMPGPDHCFSADPEELKQLVQGIRFVESSLGNPLIFPTKEEMRMRKIVRRSIVASKDILKGEKIISSDVEFKRPGTGIPPKFISMVIGKKSIKNIKKGELITFKKIK
ncbi:MAG: N-acetylneuraminate synthase family protein [Candidatus Margulisiibacteriota bacterium]